MGINQEDDIILFGDSPKFLAFVNALADLCRAHGVRLSTSDYDGLEVWDAAPGRGPIHCAGIDDRTR